MARPATRRDRYPGAQPFADDPIDQRLYFGRTREAQEVFHRVLAEPLLGHFLGPGAKAVADVVARNHEVPAVASPAAHKHMGVRLVGVEMADGDPVQTRFSKVVGDPRHDFPDEAREVRNPIAVLR